MFRCMSTMCNHLLQCLKLTQKWVRVSKGKLIHLGGIRGKRSMELRTLQGTKGTANLFMGLFIIQENSLRTTPV